MVIPRSLVDEENPDDWDGADWADRTGTRLGDVLDDERGEGHDYSYSEDWTVLSRQLRDEMDWCCAHCGIDLSTRKDLLDVHHIDHDKQHNDRSNLIVVCVYCHSLFPGHDHVLARIGKADREHLLAHQKRMGRV